ncbi:hypothetical protein EVAR_99899_1 [Eumeta japonica]|uniref:Uncharacterized protein n=1 Tax=Eumeta variegata TaxID=151549 RepID=A0A4C1ZUC7_EUMVA|nr:hypothetical protein EVAR_99899_1 [Eumeta japonica]
MNYRKNESGGGSGVKCVAFEPGGTSVDSCNGRIGRRVCNLRLILPHAGASASTSSRENQWRDSAGGRQRSSQRTRVMEHVRRWTRVGKATNRASRPLQGRGHFETSLLGAGRGTSCHELHRDGPAPVTRLLQRQSPCASQGSTCLWWSRTRPPQAFYELFLSRSSCTYLLISCTFLYAF